MERGDAANLARDVGAIIGAERVRPPRGLEARAALVVAEPRSAEEIAEIVRKCERDAIALAPFGGARTLARMRPFPAAIGVSTARMDRIIAYEPDDMTVTAEPGVTLGALNLLMASRGQRLPADPARPEITTLGALIGAAQAGPIRLSEGAVRDLLIGIRFAGHDGRIVHGGGRVVKNVAGYDLMKVMTGSFGTLGIITEATFRVRPIPENYSLAIARFVRGADAFAAALRAEESAPLIHAEVLSEALAARFGGGGALALAGFGGIRAEAEHHRGRIAEALGSGAEILAGGEALAAYEQLRDIDFADAALAAQIAVMRSDLPRCVAECGAEFRAHAASGVAQIFLADGRGAEAPAAVLARWRGIVHRARGNLRVLAARDAAQMFDQPPAPAMALMRRLKAAFDPHRVFNPGCFVGGL
jgi:glycolate oxidase FAD binding subunit